MIKLILSLFLFFPLAICAQARLELISYSGVKVERYHQFKAIFWNENGLAEDVTNSAHFSVSNYAVQRQNGEFYFKLPFFPTSSMSYTVQVAVEFKTELGQLYQDQQTIWVDISPDRVQLFGPFSLAQGSSAQFRAYGYYNGKQVDITMLGRWYADIGRVNNGFYWAPRSGSTMTRDTIRFQFGNRNQSTSITIRKI